MPKLKVKPPREVVVDIAQLRDDSLLTRKQAVVGMLALGIPCATTTLAGAATRGDGPAYSIVGGRCLYKWSNLRKWATDLVSAGEVTSTADRNAKRAARELAKFHAQPGPRGV